MEESKVIIIVEAVEDKTAKNGKAYTRFKTQIGWMSAFDSDVIVPLKTNMGNPCEVTIADDGKFKNLRKFHQVAEAVNGKITGVPVEKVEPPKPSMPSDNKTTTMYVSYAKDIFIEMIKKAAMMDVKYNIDFERGMDEAVSIVKQAKKAFENNE